MKPATLPTLIALAAILLLCGSCGEPRRFGDTGGVPVTVTVHVDRAFFSSMENRQGRPSAGAGVGFGSGGATGVGIGIGFSFSSTQVYVLGGDAVGQGNVFHQELKWGDNTFSVPLAAGRTLNLTIQAEGGRRGWEAIGTIIIPAQDPHVAIMLDGNGAKITMTPPTAPSPAVTPAPATTPAPTTTPPAATPAPATKGEPVPTPTAETPSEAPVITKPAP